MTVVDSVSDTADALLSTVNSYAASHHDGIVALLLFTGVIVAFSGRTLLRPTVFLLGFIPTTATIAAVGLAFAQDQTESKHVSLLEGITVGVALVVGVLVGVIMLRLLFRIATFILCAGFGAVLVLVAHLFLLEPAIGPNALFVLYSAVVFAALMAGLFSVSYPETGIILGTSFDGAALAVFSLARFLGHRPNVLAESVQGSDTSSPWWAVGYGTATLTLGIFGAMTQRQVANADAIIAAKTNENRSKSRQSQDSPLQPYLPGEEDNLIPFEPPHTPPYMRSGIPSPAANSGYGAVDQEDSQYSVVHNLGASPLGPSIEAYKNGKDTNGPLPL